MVLLTHGLTITSILWIGLSIAAPTGEKSIVAPHIVGASNLTTSLPPFIPSRTQPASGLNVNLNTEAEIIKQNLKWFTNHGGDLKNIIKRDTELVGNLTMETPANAPSANKTSNSVVLATANQINTFTLYAGLASTPYCRDVVPGGKWTCKNCQKYVPNGKLLVTFSSILADSNGYVLRDDDRKTIHVVFRGTNSIRSAVVDLVFTLDDYTPVKGAKVHVGFYASFKEIIRSYFSVVQEQLMAYPDYKIALSGHSLGGAQAVFAAMDLYQRDKRFTPKNLSVYTVGCPRIGNSDFANYVESTGIPFYRSVNNRDLVSHLPPASFDFVHTGTEAWIRSSTEVHICDSEAKDCSNSIVPFTNFFDHLTYYDINEGLCL